MAAFLFKGGVTDGWGLALSHLVGKFQGSGNSSGNGFRHRRKTCLVVPDGLKKKRKRTLLKEPINMIGKFPTDGLVSMKDSKRESFVKDDKIPISVKFFRDLLLNVFREILKHCKVIAVVVNPTASGEGRDNWVIRPKDSPRAGRISLSLAREFPLRERCEKVGNIGRVSIVEREIVRVTIKYATEDSIVFVRWKGDLSS